jgi:hypothetical protein
MAVELIGRGDLKAKGESGQRERRRRRARGARLAALALTAAVASLAGCSTGAVRSPGTQGDDPGFFGWHVHAPFDTSEVKTVAVFFKTNSFRRDIEKQLTEAVIKEIILRTPYRVVGRHEDADSLLTGVINVSDKNLIVEAPTNLARELNATIMMYVNWTHNPPTEIEKTRPPTIVAETLNFVPEVGETSMSGFNHVVQSIAKQIVDMMEQPWFDENDAK